MKKTGGVLLAAFAGVIIVMAAVAINKLLETEFFDEEIDDYSRYHYGLDDDDDDNHGIEYLAMS